MPDIRASGKTAAQEIAEEQARDFESLPNTPIEPKRKFRTPGFSRMRTDWTSEEQIVLERAKVLVDKRILVEFQDAYQVLNRLFDIVRTPLVDSNGEPRKDPNTGFIMWKRDEYGNYQEDWQKLNQRDKEDFLFTITTRSFAWERASQNSWAEAMWSKAVWEEMFALSFDAPHSGTIGDREAKGNIGAADERYFAILASLFSRRAEALVKSMDRLAQRLQQSLK